MSDIDLRGVKRELRFFIEQYRQGRRETIELVSSDGLRTREHVSREAEGTNDAVALVDEKLDCLVTRQGAQVDDQTRGRFLQSLKYPDFNQRRNQIDNAYNETFQWIFVGNHEDGSGEDYEHFSEIKWASFSNWLRSTNTLYWISGKPGSGKTTLVKYILAHERTERYLNIWSPGCAIVSHYFWKPGSRMQKNIEGLFYSLLYQLLGKDLIALKDVMSSVPGGKDSYTDWSSAELRSALLRTLDSYRSGVCLFLDGLDELDPEDGTKDGISELLDLVFELSQRGKIKLCVASRPDPHILEMRLCKYPRLRLQDLNYKDMMAYAKEKVKFPEARETDRGLIESLVYKAEGVFLWLVLATKSINEGIRYHDSVQCLQERIHRLPKDLDSLYQDMWVRAGANSPPEYRQTAALYFKLLIASKCYPGKPRNFTGQYNLYDQQRVNIFDLMLATTSIADEVLSALDGASKPICKELMLEKCREVERKLKVCCVGLVEVGAETPFKKQDAAYSSWYGHMYDDVWPIARSSGLQFIHRTAYDFLSDTELGAKILSFSCSSDFTSNCQLMKAWLAKLALFARGGSPEIWVEELRKFREAWEDTDEWSSEDWSRLILIYEKLANSGRLFTGVQNAETACIGIDFLRVLTRWNCDDGIIISRLKNGNLSENEKSAILMSLSDSHIHQLKQGEQAQNRLRTFRELLWAGADPNWQSWETRGGDVSVTSLRTSWQCYLLKVIQYFCSEKSVQHSARKQTELTIARVVLLFISNGARLDEMVDMVMIWDEKVQSWIPCEILGAYWSDDGLFVSIPASIIVASLTKALRSFPSLSDEDSLLESCVSLERAYASHRSSKTCRVFGKTGHPGREVSLWETTNDMQSQLGSRLIECLKRQIMSRIATIEDDTELKARSVDRKEISQSILDDESWTMKARGVHDLWEWLQELQLVGFSEGTPESRPIKEWVRKRSHNARI
ncbi:hypothetical protein N8I77_000140 [Diaporthe amygdali]|uniref:NACHT domain-containing protein n=1 Tax=Phomopsis amygdali TaxID=1214568 RepID=A0AAD9SNY9_PHOAM|nr:hypothetical protein N8I77_000140 [Diaporthe amygdali]